MKTWISQGHSLASFKKDLVSGLLVGVIAIPLGMGFAIASGVKPEYGIYTTIIAGILISIFGGSKYQIGGPTGAFIPILFGIVMTYGYEKLLIAGFLAGILLVVMGVLKLGSFIKFIPRSVTIGFTSGIAVIIFSGQITNFLGLRDIVKHEYFLENMREIVVHVSTVNFYSLLTALICFGVIVLTSKLFPKVPGALLGIVCSSIVAAVFYADQIATIGSTYGEISNALPRFQMPDFNWSTIVSLIQPAVIIAFLGGIESLLSALVADGMTNSKHNSNRELIGQGIANMVTPLFGGIPATGAIARTATNIKSGATSRVSGVIHGGVVLLTLLLLAPFASKIPLASMAPVLMFVAWNMSERHEFLYVLKARNSDSLVLIVTFLLTIFTNLTDAVLIGMLLAVILFTKRMSNILAVTHVVPDPNRHIEQVIPYSAADAHYCPQICIFDVEGPLFFGVAQTFENTVLDVINYHPTILILRMGRVPFIDITCEVQLKNIVSNFSSKGGKVLIAEIQEQPKQLLLKTGLWNKIGNENFYEHTGEAIDFALMAINQQKCIGCDHCKR